MKTKWLALFLLLAFAVPTFGQGGHDAKESTPALAPRGILDVPAEAVDKTYAALHAAMPASIITQVQISDYLCVSNPGNPPLGKIRFYCDSGTSKLVCIDSTGANACPGGGGGGGSPGGGNGAVQCNISSSFGPCNATDLASVFSITEPTIFLNGTTRIFGPVPYSDLATYGGYINASPPQTTASTTNGSTAVTLASAIDFKDATSFPASHVGNGIVIYKAGAATSLSTPPAPTATPYGVINGATTYTYNIVAEDYQGGLTAASSNGVTTTGATALGVNTVNLTGAVWNSTLNGEQVYTCSGNCNIGDNSPVNIAGFTNTHFNGNYTTIAHTSSTFTVYSPLTPAVTSESVAATVKVLACNAITLPSSSVPNTVEASGTDTVMRWWLYRNGTVAMPIQSRDPYYEDCGMTASGTNVPSYVPATPGSAVNKYLATTLVSGAGTTSIVVADQAGATVSGQTALHDNSKNLLTALGNSHFGTPVYVSGGNVFNAATVFTSATSSNTKILLPTNLGINQPWVVATNGIVFEGGETVGSNSFQLQNVTNLGGGAFAFPLVLVASPGAGSNVQFKNILFNAPQFGEIAFVRDTNGVNGAMFGLQMDNVGFGNNATASNVNASAAIFKNITESSIGKPGNRNSCSTAQVSPGPVCIRFTTNSTAVSGSSVGNIAGVVQVHGFAVQGGGTSIQVDAWPATRSSGSFIAGISSLRFVDGLREIGKGPYLRIVGTTGNFWMKFIDDDAPNAASGNGWVDAAAAGSEDTFSFESMTSSVGGQVAVAGPGIVNFDCSVVFSPGTTLSSGNAAPASVGSSCGGSEITSGYNQGFLAKDISSIGYAIGQPNAPVVTVGASSSCVSSCVAAGTYFYGIVANDLNGGVSSVSPLTSATTDGTQTVTVSWTPIDGQVTTNVGRSTSSAGVNFAYTIGSGQTGTSYVDGTNAPANPSGSFYSVSAPTILNGKATSMGSAGLTAAKLNFTGGNFAATLSGTFTATRTQTVQDASGTIPLLTGAYNNADCLQVSKIGSVVFVVDAGNPCGSGGGGGATFQVNGTNTSTQTLINFQSSSAFNGLTVSFSNPSAGNVTLGLSGTATKALLPATTVYTDQANTFGAFAQDFGASSLLVPGSSGVAPTTNRSIAYDTTANRYTAGLNGAPVIFPWFASGTPVNNQCPQWSGTAGLLLSLACASTANPLSQFAATSSAQLASIMSDETGTGVLVFNSSPTIITPTVASFVNAQHNHSNAAGGGQITDSALSSPVGATKGGSGLSTISADQIPVGTSLNVFTAQTITDCPAAGGGHLNYAQSTHTFACGTAGVISGLTTNVIPKASSSTSIADSLLTDNGTTLTYTGTGGMAATGYNATGTGGLTLTGTEGVAPSGVPGSDIIWADSTAHRWKANNNNGGATTVAMFSDTLSVFAATTSAQLAGVISDEVGSGALMFSPKQDIMDAASFCADAGASGTTYLCNLTPAITAYVTGTHYRFKANTANTGSSTINFNSLGAKTIVKAAGGITTVLVANDMRAGQWVDLVYDGTNMQMQSTSGNAIAGSGTVTSVAVTVPAFLSVSGSPITSNGTFAISLANENANTIFAGPSSGSAAAPTFRAMVPADVVLGVNAQTSAGYTVVTGDQGKLVTVSNSVAQTLTLPSSAPAAGWWIAVENTGAGTWTVSRNGLNIDGAASNFNLTTNQGVVIYSDGSNYFTQRGVGGAGGGSVTTTGSPASGNLTKFSGATSITNGDLAGDVTTSGTLTTTLANIPSAVPMAGSILATNITAPGTPASGKDSLYTDSTDLRFHDKNASGVIGTTVVADTGASHNFLTAISVAGAISKAQPTFADLAAGTVAAVGTFPGGDFFMGGIDAQTGTSYTVLSSDENKLLTFNNGSAVAVTLPQATTGGFTAGAQFYVFNRGAGAVTITPTTSTINGSATAVLNQNQGAYIVSDGTNYSAWISAAPSGSGTVTSVAEQFTGGLLSISGSPITTSGTFSWTVAGTSGGVVCFTGSATWASSSALAANGVVLGGGAGVCPTVTAADTTTTHALFATATAPAFRAIVAGDLPNIPLNQVVSPTGAVATFASGNNALTFNSATTTNSQAAVTFGETSAATGTGDVEVQISTASGSTAIPLQLTQGAGVSATDAPLAVNLTGGTGGANGGATNPGKKGGGITLTTGAGSGAGATSGTGGAGGDVNLTAGNGGAAAVGSTTGKGGDVIFTPGTAGATGTAGAPGQAKVVCATVGAALTTPCVNVTGTWNTTGVVDAALFVNITNTASGTGSLLADLQIGGTSEFKVDKTGAGTFNASVTTTGSTAGALLCTAGSANGHATASTITTECPASVTAYENVMPSAAASGIVSNSNSSSVVTQSVTGDANHSTHSTGQTATKTIYTLCPASAGGCNVAGQYAIDWYFNQGGTACASVTAGGVTFALSWTDNAGAHSAVAMPMFDANSSTATSTQFHFQTSNTAAWASGHFVIWSTGAQPIQITNTYTACTTGTGTWELAATAVQLQ